MTTKTPTSVAYLGPEGSFSHLAATLFFDNSAALKPVKTIEDVFEATAQGRTSHGLVPIENSKAGSVDVSLEVLCSKKYQLKICDEFFFRVELQLLSQAKSLKDIKEVHSHPNPLSQSRQWLKKNLPHAVIKEATSTSEAAKIAQKDPKVAAISTQLAASLYDLKVLAKNVEDRTDNITRFLVISPKDAAPTGHDKTSILFYLKKEQPGALYRLLGPLNRRQINMTRIESKIMTVGNWDYHFFLDFEGHRKDPQVKKALQEMEEYCTSLIVLGSYPKGEKPIN